MKLLRQSTSVLINVGPILGTDFLTPQTSITLSTNRAELYQAGSNTAIDIAARTWAHIAGGVYALTLTAGDTSVLGPMLIHIHPASAMPLTAEANVLSQGAWDALCAGGQMPADVQKMNGSLTAASNMGAAGLGITRFTVGNSSSTILVSTDLSNSTSSFYVGRTVVFTSGALAGQASAITAYNGSTKQLTVAQLTSAPASGDTAVIV
jgi:hypothetical protein